MKQAKLLFFHCNFIDMMFLCMHSSFLLHFAFNFIFVCSSSSSSSAAGNQIHWNGRQFKSKYLIISFQKQITFNYWFHILWPLILSVSIRRAAGGMRNGNEFQFYDMMNNSKQQQEEEHGTVYNVCAYKLMRMYFYWTQLFNCCADHLWAAAIDSKVHTKFI